MKTGTDWLVIRTWGKDDEEFEICILTTRADILARHLKKVIRNSVLCSRFIGKVPGLRRYKTKIKADEKVSQLNEKYKTTGYQSIQERRI